MNTYIYLSTCNTCMRTEGSQLPEGTKLQDVKHDPISQAQLEALYAVTHSASNSSTNALGCYKPLTKREKPEPMATNSF